jgi:hypothetical protein
MSQIGRRFALSDQHGHGVSCDEKGVFVGSVPLVEPCHGCAGLKKFRPRPLADLNRDLSKRYGLPIDLGAKTASLTSIAQALSRGDILHAQIATLHLRIPEPPPLANVVQSTSQVLVLAKELRASGLLKADWDPLKHPRWPAGSPDGIGGEFAPAGTASGDSVNSESRPSAIPAQITIPVPFELPGIPVPSEIVPAPVIPDINPRSQLRNPFPDRPECEEEWAHALEYCGRLMGSGRMGKEGSRGFGRTFMKCVLGMVREDCGGSLTS